MAVALLEREGLAWDAFRRHLIPVIAARPDATYYEQFVDALSAFGDELAAARES